MTMKRWTITHHQKSISLLKKLIKYRARSASWCFGPSQSQRITLGMTKGRAIKWILHDCRCIRCNHVKQHDLSKFIFTSSQGQKYGLDFKSHPVREVFFFWGVHLPPPFVLSLSFPFSGWGGGDGWFSSTVLSSFNFFLYLWTGCWWTMLVAGAKYVRQNNYVPLPRGSYLTIELQQKNQKKQL